MLVGPAVGGGIGELVGVGGGGLVGGIGVFVGGTGVFVGGIGVFVGAGPQVSYGVVLQVSA